MLFSPTRSTEVKARAIAAADQYKLRALPNDDVYYFYVKRIDNSRVIRQADPRAEGSVPLRDRCPKCVLAVLAGSVMVPKLGSCAGGIQDPTAPAGAGNPYMKKSALWKWTKQCLMSAARLDELAQTSRSYDRPGYGQVVHLAAQW